MLDWHCHILPGLDDGPADPEESTAIARLLLESGFQEVCCTPHCIPGLFDLSPALIRAAAADMQSALDRAGIPLRLRPGMEYYLDERFPSLLPDLQPLGDSRVVLVEVPTRGDDAAVLNGVCQLLDRGYTPLIAHPERSPLLTEEFPSSWVTAQVRRLFRSDRPEPLLSRLLEMGCLFQGDLGSFVGAYGSQIRIFAERFLAAGIYACFGSDAHRLAGLDRILNGGLAAVAGYPEGTPELEAAAAG